MEKRVQSLNLERSLLYITRAILWNMLHNAQFHEYASFIRAHPLFYFKKQNIERKKVLLSQPNV